MPAKLKPTLEEFVDPDDAPELTEEFFRRATYYIDEKVVTEKEFWAAANAVPQRARPKKRSTLR